jgi:glycerol-3-phosphate dehydrogenase
VDSSGLVTITGGKWTTYRKMAEDAVDSAAVVGGLEFRPSVTQELPIKASGDRSLPGPALLHIDLTYTSNDVVNAVRNEMARNVEDVLARRTRALFLNARAAVEIAPEVARIMAGEMNRSEKWIKGQIAVFETTARAYSVEITSSP